MKLSRVVATRLAAVTLLLSVPCAAAAQNAPKLERVVLEAVVAAVDQASAASTPATWYAHVLRASNGAHDVALRTAVSDLAAPNGGVMLATFG